jgi:hypothetical protein
MVVSLANVNAFTEIITPYLPVLGVALGGLIVGIFAAYNRHKGNVETRAPDVNAIWQQQAYQNKELDHERKWRRRLENYAWDVIEIFRGYVKRVQSGGSTDLTHKEKTVITTDPPTAEIPIQKESV